MNVPDEATDYDEHVDFLNDGDQFDHARQHTCRYDGADE